MFKSVKSNAEGLRVAVDPEALVAALPPLHFETAVKELGALSEHTPSVAAAMPLQSVDDPVYAHAVYQVDAQFRFRPVDAIELFGWEPYDRLKMMWAPGRIVLERAEWSPAKSPDEGATHLDNRSRLTLSPAMRTHLGVRPGGRVLVVTLAGADQVLLGSLRYLEQEMGLL